MPLGPVPVPPAPAPGDATPPGVRVLGSGWRLSVLAGAEGVPGAVAAGPVAARVPGCAHTDLRAAGLIPDPYVDRNELDLKWIGRSDWRYETEFSWWPGGAARTDLVCEGLDTLATVRVNGAVVGRTRNMHRSYRFDLRPYLRPGENRLTVDFAAPVPYVEAQRDRLGDLPHAEAHPFQFLRKNASNFGWDWGPDLATCGIWRPLSVHAWDTARLERVRPFVTVEDGSRGRVAVHVDVERADRGADENVGGGADGGAAAGPGLLLWARVAGHTVRALVAPGERSAVLDLTVEEVELWWPSGYGEQPLYRLEVGLSEAEGGAGGGPGAELDSWARSVGFRTVELHTAPDPETQADGLDGTAPGRGSAFTFVVNGRPVFARGANWVPEDCFPGSLPDARYRERLGQARDAHLNLVRVWGGGIYESRAFYEACDELGLLVWQDFLFACAAYPEEPELWAEVEAEAREAVARLSPHPSLAVWNGNNENLWGWWVWGWPELVGDRPWGAGYYLDLLPRVVAETDPTRPYWAGSPWSGDEALHPNSDDHGCTHIWDVWNERDYLGYRDYVPRFCSEFGWQAPPAWATLRSAVRAEPLAADSPGVLHHQKAIGGNGKLERGLAHHFRAPGSFDDWLYLTQVNQARAVRLGVEHLRSHSPRCMGSVVWQLNDCWPATSWSLVDGAGRRKPVWYALRRSYADRLLTLQPRDGGLAVCAVNDADTAWEGEVVVRRTGFDGTVRAEERLSLACAARSAVTLPLPAALHTPDRPEAELLRAVCGAETADWFFLPDKELACPKARFTVTVGPSPEGANRRVTVRAHTLVRDLALFADRVHPDASTEDMLVTLLPGEETTLTLRSPVTPDPAALAAPPVLRCVNDIAGATAIAADGIAADGGAAG